MKMNCSVFFWFVMYVFNYEYLKYVQCAAVSGYGSISENNENAPFSELSVPQASYGKPWCKKSTLSDITETTEHQTLGKNIECILTSVRRMILPEGHIVIQTHFVQVEGRLEQLLPKNNVKTKTQ